MENIHSRLTLTKQDSTNLANAFELTIVGDMDDSDEISKVSTFSKDSEYINEYINIVDKIYDEQITEHNCDSGGGNSYEMTNSEKDASWDILPNGGSNGVRDIYIESFIYYDKNGTIYDVGINDTI